MTLDELLDKFKRYSKEPNVWIRNVPREIEFKQAYKGIEKIVLEEDPDATIVCKMHELNDGSAVIEVISDWLTIKEVEKFCESISKANNFEIYPLNNGKVQFNVMFNAVLKRAFY